MTAKINIEIVYGLPHQQSLLALMVDDGITIEAAIEASGILSMHDEIDLEQNKVGVWNKSKKLTQTLREGDRIEIYRPLIADPKAVRKQRAEKAKAEGRADKVTGGRPDPQRASTDKKADV
jgi:putative ubiquitin-RnfH superfamily antitoxin RatB of RatAB toxin-antitoxin module